MKMTITSTWSSLSSWFTPTILFCFLNLMIAVIFLTSRRKQSSSSSEEEDADSRRATSLLQRVKSINFSSFNWSDHHTPKAAEPSEEETKHEVTRSKSESIAPAPVKKALKKSMSEKPLKATAEDVVRRPATVRERKGKGVVGSGRSAAGEDDRDGIDGKADDFINRFRQQLKLQRMDSILRYTDMLKRGAAR